MIETARNNYLELSKRELDLVILSHIESAMMCTDKLRDAYAEMTKWRKHGRQKGKDVERHKLMFTFYHLPVCRSFFLFVHACGRKRFENLLRHFHTHGAITRVHGLANKPSTHARAFQPCDIQKAVKFIEYTADLLALPLPGRLPKFKDYRVMKLPSNETKASVYRKYISSLGNDEPKMSIRSFRRIWAKYIPYVTVMNPADDLCDYCRMNSITQAKNVPELEREEKLHLFLDHLQKARNQRAYYQEWCDNTDDTVKVLSFDFAQTVHYPVSPQQPGAAYFKAKKKCAVFGITDEKGKIQYNYMIDEEHDIGKGPNTVVSILHYHLETYCKNVQTIVLFCDNCVGQSKNNAMISYLQWRLVRGLNTTILLNFLLTVHTKFSPDQFFGIFKARYAITNIDTYEELLQCVVQSSPGGHNTAVSSKKVVWYEWDSYFKPFYKPLEGITQFHHFIMGKNSLKTKEFADSKDVESFQLSLIPVADTMPEIIQPVGLSLQRQWYIYQNLRSLVSDPTNADILAPLPSEKMLSKKSEDASPATKVASKEPKASSSNQDPKKKGLKKPATSTAIKKSRKRKASSPEGD
ncbi:uncharacterized protein [Eurosta solidaginis]